MRAAEQPWWERPVFVFGVGIPLVVALLSFVAIRYIHDEGRVQSQSRAVWLLRFFCDAARQYAQEYENGFPPTLAVLAQPAPGDEPSCRAAGGNWESVLAGPVRGYRFEYRPGAPVENPRAGCPPGVKSYTLVARPDPEKGRGDSLLLLGRRRSFLLDESGVIHWTTEDREPRADDPAFNVLTGQP